MCRRFALVVCLLAVALALTQISHAAGSIQVIEPKTTITIGDNQSSVNLSLENSTGKPAFIRAEVEILDPQGQVRGSGRTQLKSTSRTSNAVVTIQVPRDKLVYAEKELVWYRIHYRLTPASDAPTQPIADGIISLSEIMPSLFNIRVAAPRMIREGSQLHAQVKAMHPLTGQAAAGVELEGEVSYDSDKKAIKSRSRTDKNGFATLDFTLPSDLGDSEELPLNVTAQKGPEKQTVSGEVELDRSQTAMLSTDKPLYQPGQTLHVRALLFNSANQALADKDVQLEISDPEGNASFRTELKTSRFGVASADWLIPESTRLGDYKLELSTADGDDALGSETVKISRYDLPNFRVDAQPDRPFYLPGQNADIQVSATYLFGQPVKRAKVRLVREKERRWNFREQKYDVEETEVFDGTFDDSERYVAHVDLSKAFADLTENDYQRFQDFTYAAYVTDPTTNRTEQRRFDLRVTREPIHVYIIQPQTSLGRKHPLDFYVSTSYADGSPAECEVSIFNGATHLESAGTDGNANLVKQVRTNHYGVARVDSIKLPSQSEVQPYQSTLSFIAIDNKGQRGHQENHFWRGDEEEIVIKTDKAIYKPGEPMYISITAEGQERNIFVDIAQDSRILQSEMVSLRDGRANLTIPYKKEFAGLVSISAFNGLDEYGRGASRTVIFPHDRNLKLSVRTEREEFLPGENAHASVSVKTADGFPAESAIGVVITDRAVEERAKTETDFGDRFGFLPSYKRFAGSVGSVGGITVNDLNKLDPSRPIPADLDLAAEVLLSNNGGGYSDRLLEEGTVETDVQSLFRDDFAKALKPAHSELFWHYFLTGDYPKDDQTIRAYLSAGGIELDKTRDPWGNAFRTRFGVDLRSNLTEFVSAGPDKRFDTADDIVALQLRWDYFLPYQDAFEAAVRSYHNRTGAYILDGNVLRDELLRMGFDFSSLRDGWGRPYKATFGVDKRNYTIHIVSSGPNKRFESDKSSTNSDDFFIWIGNIDYFQETESRIDAALQKYTETTRRLPANGSEVRKAFESAGINWSEMRDPWGRPYALTINLLSRAVDHLVLKSYQVYGSSDVIQKTEITPITTAFSNITVSSVGPDGKPQTEDDFKLATFSLDEPAPAATDATLRGKNKFPRTLNGITGAITGTVTDLNGAVVPNAAIKASLKYSSQEFTTTTDEDGRYLLRNLPSGLYKVEITSPGFQIYVYDSVPVQSTTLTKADATLTVGSVTSSVEVTSGAVDLEMTSSQLSAHSRQNPKLPFPPSRRASPMLLSQASTPRLRNYFPETLVWLPSLETDKRGRTSFDFKFADNVTTWKMAVIGSTEDGRIGFIEKDLRSFQPFFVDHDPPKILTEGDEISLPVVVRNYLQRPQEVSVVMKTEPWFSMLGPATKSVQVPSGDSTRETFDLRTVASVREGPQRVTAFAGDANDAIEKPVTVHPDGEENVASASLLFLSEARLTVNLPADALLSAKRGELKIYPNLLAHISEGIEGILERPHGCGEQTISSTYPNLIALRYLKESEKEQAVAAKARKYLQAGYDRLLSYRTPDGGFSYWGRNDEPDLALTAYALRFLTDAREFIDVNSDVIDSARTWMINHQRPDGSWPSRYHWSEKEDANRSPVLTAYIAKTLAMIQRSEKLKNVSGPAIEKRLAEDSASSAALKRAIALLAQRSQAIDEPYLIASYAAAAFAANNLEAGSTAASRLRAMARSEGGMAYWSQEANTPFYGWGLAGSVETTALVIQALVRDAETNGDDHAVEADKQLVDRGLLFLLKLKDRYGVWYSTQATVNVFDAFSAIASRRRESVNPSLNANQTEVLVNGNHAATLEIPNDGRLVPPILVDVTKFLANGENVVEIKRQGQPSEASAQLLSTYYMPWSASKAAAQKNARANDSDALRLAVSFDKTTASISDEITCHVEAERIGFHGYGMMLAEIGLPPGADVDRASIEHAMREAGWGINQYDVLPDRLVVYLWPRAGGTKFDFKFKPRFGLKAKSAPSVLYDYYNPEARTTVTPTAFVVR